MLLIGSQKWRKNGELLRDKCKEFIGKLYWAAKSSLFEAGELRPFESSRGYPEVCKARAGLLKSLLASSYASMYGYWRSVEWRTAPFMMQSAATSG